VIVIVMPLRRHASAFEGQLGSSYSSCSVPFADPATAFGRRPIEWPLHVRRHAHTRFASVRLSQANRKRMALLGDAVVEVFQPARLFNHRLTSTMGKASYDGRVRHVSI
jgi:hypothetical protein